MQTVHRRLPTQQAGFTQPNYVNSTCNASGGFEKKN